MLEKSFCEYLDKKALNALDIKIQSQLQALKGNKNFTSSNGFPPPPLPPAPVFPLPSLNNRPPSSPPPPTSFFSSSHIGIPCALTALPLSPIPTAPPFSQKIPTAPPLSPRRVFSF